MNLQRERFEFIICSVLTDSMQTDDGDVTAQLNKHDERNLYIHDLNLGSIHLEA